MDIVALLAAAALPWMLGIALLAALHGRERWDAPGTLAWICGAGWFAGVFVVTLWLRALFAPAREVRRCCPSRFRSPSRHSRSPRSHGGAIAHDPAAGARAAIGTLVAEDRSGWRKAAWLGLVLWIALRLALLLLEVSGVRCFRGMRGRNGRPRPDVWFELGALAPFADSAAWLAGTGAYTDSAPGFPATVPLFQVWTATLLGHWDDALVNLPWWRCGVALAMAVYGFLVARRLPPVVALIGTWLIVSLPILDVHVALAGYADLPLSAYLTLAVLASLRAIDRREPYDMALAVLCVVAVPLIKPAGIVWLAVLAPGLAAAAFPAWGRRIGVACLVAAVVVVTVGVRSGLLAAGAMGFERRSRRSSKPGSCSRTGICCGSAPLPPRSCAIVTCSRFASRPFR